MPQNKDLKRLVRARMAETGKNYTQALAHLRDQAVLEPLPAAWRMTGSRVPDYGPACCPRPAATSTHRAALAAPGGLRTGRLRLGGADWTRASIVLDFGTAPTAVPQHGR